MSWLYSRALVEASSAGISLDGAQCALWSGTPTPPPSWLPDKTTEPLRLSRSGMTCRRLTDTLGADVLTWCLGDSHAPTSAPLDVAPALTGPHQGCGATWRESSVRYDRATLSWKTHRCLWVEDLPESSVTLPRSGTMLDGVCWERLTPELPTNGTGSGSLPTPRATDGTKGSRTAEGAAKEWARGRNKDLGMVVAMLPTPTTTAVSTDKAEQTYQRDKERTGHPTWQAVLAVAARKWPTPTTQDAKNNGAPSQLERNTAPLNAQVGGALNPTWVEWLMGWPLGWTDCDASEMDKYQEWCASHGAL